MDMNSDKRKKPAIRVSEKIYNDLAELAERDQNTISLDDIGIDNASDVKKQIPLRISAKLFGDLSDWADDDFRSINGQIEYLLSECVKKRKGTG